DQVVGSRFTGRHPRGDELAAVEPRIALERRVYLLPVGLGAEHDAPRPIVDLRAEHRRTVGRKAPGVDEVRRLEIFRPRSKLAPALPRRPRAEVHAAMEQRPRTVRSQRPPANARAPLLIVRRESLIFREGVAEPTEIPEHVLARHPAEPLDAVGE